LISIKHLRRTFAKIAAAPAKFALTQSGECRDANPCQKICPHPRAERTRDGGRRLRLVRGRPRRLELPLLTSQGFLLIMMIAGAVGFYVGIDTPPLPFHPHEELSAGGSGGGVDTAEFLTAAGTFCATLTAFVSVGLIVLHADAHILWTYLIMLGWIAGVGMQVVSGAIARMRPDGYGARPARGV